MGQSAKKIKIYSILSETSCEIFTPFFIVLLARSLWCRALQHWQLNGGFTFDLQRRRRRLVARRCLECWSATLFLSSDTAALPMFSLSFFPSTISVLCKLVDTGQFDSPYLWMTLPTDLVGRVKSHSLFVQTSVCVCVCVYMWEYALLSFCVLPLAPFLTCYYKDMTQCTRECDHFLLFFSPLFHLACWLHHQATPWKHTDIKCSLWLLISRFALGLSGWHC